MTEKTQRAPTERRRPRPRTLLIGAACAGLVGGVVLQRATMEEAGAVVPSEDLAAVDAFPRHVASSSEEQPEPQMAANLPIYPGSRPERLGERANLHDLSLEMAWFTTPDSVEDVLYWYKDTLAEAGIPVLSGRLTRDSQYVGYENPTTGEVHTATILDFNGETLVFPALGRRDEREVRGAEAIPTELPHPPSAEETAVMTVSEMGAMQYSVASSSSEGTEALTRFYREELPRMGWTIEQSSHEPHRSATLIARRGRLNAQVVLYRDTAEGFPVTRIHVTMTRRA